MSTSWNSSTCTYKSDHTGFKHFHLHRKYCRRGWNSIPWPAGHTNSNLDDSKVDFELMSQFWPLATQMACWKKSCPIQQVLTMQSTSITILPGRGNHSCRLARGINNQSARTFPIHACRAHCQGPPTWSRVSQLNCFLLRSWSKQWPMLITVLHTHWVTHNNRFHSHSNLDHSRRKSVAP